MQEATNSAPDANTINTILAKTVDRTILNLQFQSAKSEALEHALQNLKDIVSVYGKTQEQLYLSTVGKLQQVDLLEFEAKSVLEALIQGYFSRLPLFRQAYEIAVLHSQDQKYKRLIVEEPEIQLSIPIPFQSEPLERAKQIGQARCLLLQDQIEEGSSS